MVYSWVYHITAKSLNIAHCHGVFPYSLDKPNCVTFATVAVPREQFVGRGYPAKRCSSRHTKLVELIRALATPRGEKKTFERHAAKFLQSVWKILG